MMCVRRAAVGQTDGQSAKNLAKQEGRHGRGRGGKGIEFPVHPPPQPPTSRLPPTPSKNPSVQEVQTPLPHSLSF